MGLTGPPGGVGLIAGGDQGDAEAGQALFARLGRENYIPETAREAYAPGPWWAGCASSWARLWLRSPPPGAGLTARILGQGCPRCEALTVNVLGALGEMGLAADVEHLHEIKQLVAYSVMGTPALVINNQVMCAGQTHSLGQLRRWLAMTVGR